jgi:alpha-N-arabinofuranosidase
LRDDFDSPKLAHCWNHLRNPDPAQYSLTDRPGSLRLSCGKATLDDQDSPAFIGRRQEHLDCEVSTLLDFTPKSEIEEAGLTVLADNRHHCELAVTLLGGKRCAIVRRRIGSLSAEVACMEIPDGPVELAIHADKTTYRFLAGTPGSLKELATAETRYVSTQVAGGYTGVYFGLYATANGEKSTTKAFFDWFECRVDG